MPLNAPGVEKEKVLSFFSSYDQTNENEKNCITAKMKWKTY